MPIEETVHSISIKTKTCSTFLYGDDK